MLNPEYAVIVILIVLLVVQNYVHCTERKKLLDRIMSKDLTEFKNVSEKHQLSNSRVLTGHERVMRNWRNPNGENPD